MNKTLTKKLIYVIAVVAMLAMMIPATGIPAFASDATMNPNQMVLISPLNSSVTMPDAGYNLRGDIVQVTASGPVTSWSINPPTGVAQFVTPNVTVPPNSVWVQGFVGDVTITALLASGNTEHIDKKFSQVINTTITPSGSSVVTWNEQAKSWSGTASFTDVVTGNYTGPTPAHAEEGVILNWFLIPGTVSIPVPAEAPALNAAMLTLIGGPTGNPNDHINFTTGLAGVTYTANPHYVQTVTDSNGSSTVTITGNGEEAVTIVVIPEYPGDPQIFVTPEWTTWDFYTTEMDVVPQVRWAGEKIVLEKNFGDGSNASFPNNWVKFTLQNQSVGSLEAVTGTENLVNSQAVWTKVDSHGFASCILTSSDEGVSQVTAALYTGNTDTSTLLNQHYFTVYFLKLESLKLGDVSGKRVGHDSGLWTPSNPWNVASDTTAQTLNVSSDALMRANVKGWFTSSNPSARPVRYIDPTNASGMADLNAGNAPPTSLVLPAGRWILPDDWAALAGPNWQMSRLHWDIMNDPYGTNPGGIGSFANNATSSTPDNLGIGTYAKPIPALTTVVAGNYPTQDVIGPFSPGLELMTPTGWTVPNHMYDSKRPMQTVVPDGNLDMWDAPMPPAKIIFQIQSAGATVPNVNIAGFFKSAMKTDIYYIMVPNGSRVPSDPPVKVYTNPFYQEMIPAHEAIPVFINNGGYDWNSFDTSYGPYKFWTMINQSTNNPQVATSDPAGHPTAVEVYSDNHGEAMVWLNGNWNLDLDSWVVKGSTADIPVGTVVGTTTVQATADYPYSRVHEVIQSNKDVKTWLWTSSAPVSYVYGQVLGTDSHMFPTVGGTQPISSSVNTRMVLSAGTWDSSTKTGTFPYETAKSADEVVWVWVTDRDGTTKGVLGAEVDWQVTGFGASISNFNGALSQYNPVTQGIFLTSGFLSNTGGVIGTRTAQGIIPDPSAMNGVSYLRLPTAQEMVLFNKFWGTGYNSNPATSAINGLDATAYCVAALDLQSTAIPYTAASVAVTADILSNDFNHVWGQSVMGDLTYSTAVDFNIANSLDDGIRFGDANGDGVVNMGDVTTVERMILGYQSVNSNAVMNKDGTVDMGTVVKIERTILGLK